LLNVETLTVSIQNLFKSSYDRGAASVIGILLFLAAAIFVLFESILKGRDFESRGAEGFQERIRRISNPGLSVFTILVIALYGFLAVVIPFYVLISRYLQNPSVVAFSDLFSAALSTVSVAGLGAFIAFILSLPLALLATQGPRDNSHFACAAGRCGWSSASLIRLSPRAALSINFLTRLRVRRFIPC